MASSAKINPFINLQPGLIFGLLFPFLFYACGYKNNPKKHSLSTHYNYLSPVDTLTFDYTSGSKASPNNELTGYPEDFYGNDMILRKDGTFLYVSINAEKKLHTFDFKTNKHHYSGAITQYPIEAYRVDSNALYLLYNGFLYKKNFRLETIDSFKYPIPAIAAPHDIDYDRGGSHNLFKIGKYFVLMYYVVNTTKKGSDIYQHTNPLFYYFNRDTAFFADKGCLKIDSTFEYFRYPAITSDGQYIYDAPRVKSCIAKSNELKTVLTGQIDKHKNNYLTIKYGDQYMVSKIKRYRLSTDFNRDLISTPDGLFLLKEIPQRIYKKNGITHYDRNLEIIKFDKQLHAEREYYIKDIYYSYAFINNNKLYLFHFSKNNCYVYKI